jgi:hypothetical protein
MGRIGDMEMDGLPTPAGSSSFAANVHADVKD